MKLLADENIPACVVDALSQADHDVVRISEIAQGCPDIDVWNLARRDERIILTFDKDFGHMTFSINWQGVEPGKPLPIGVILFRFRLVDPESLARHIVSVIQSRADWAGSFSVVDETGIRMRPYPLSLLS